MENPKVLSDKYNVQNQNLRQNSSQKQNNINNSVYIS